MQLMWYEKPLFAVIVAMKLFLSAYKEANFLFTIEEI